MRYIDYLKTLDRCPFCHIEQEKLQENEHAYLTYALAPYHKYHLLVIPKRHVEQMKDLEWTELISITALVADAIKVLDKLGHNDCSVLVKDNNKSVNHLHYNIIPGGVITDISLDTEVRPMLTKKEQEFLMAELERVVQI